MPLALFVVASANLIKELDRIDANPTAWSIRISNAGEKVLLTEII